MALNTSLLQTTESSLKSVEALVVNILTLSSNALHPKTRNGFGKN